MSRIMAFGCLVGEKRAGDGRRERPAIRIGGPWVASKGILQAWA
jgi:hypothetical protein